MILICCSVVRNLPNLRQVYSIDWNLPDCELQLVGHWKLAITLQEVE